MKKLLPYLTFGALAIALLAPIVRPGYVFLLDMVWGPELIHSSLFASEINASLPLLLLLKLSALLLPLVVIQKLILVGVLTLAGCSTYLLARRWFPIPWALASGVLSMVNPWAWERLHAGHWLVLLGIALIPLLIHTFMNFLASYASPGQERALRSRIPFIILFCMYPWMSLHWAYIGFGIVAVMSFFFWIKKRPAPLEKVPLRTIAIICALWVIVNQGCSLQQSFLVG